MFVLTLPQAVDHRIYGFRFGALRSFCGPVFRKLEAWRDRDNAVAAVLPGLCQYLYYLRAIKIGVDQRRDQNHLFAGPTLFFIDQGIANSFLRRSEAFYKESIIRDGCRHEDPVLGICVRAEVIKWWQTRLDFNAGTGNDAVAVGENILDQGPCEFYRIGPHLFC